MAKMTRIELIEALADKYNESGWAGVADGVQDLTGEVLPDTQVYQFDLRIQAETEAQAKALADTLLAVAERDESLTVSYALRDDEPVVETTEEPIHYEKGYVQWTDREKLRYFGPGILLTTSFGEEWVTRHGSLVQSRVRVDDRMDVTGFRVECFPLKYEVLDKPKAVSAPELLPATLTWYERQELSKMPLGTRYRAPESNGSSLWEVVPGGNVAIVVHNGQPSPRHWIPADLGPHAFPMILDYPKAD